MLKEISISNFKSINDELTFSMEADVERVSEHPNHILNINNNSILKISSMYGPNGGGKSNILSAIYIVKSLFFSSENNTMYPQEFTCVFNSKKNIEITIFFINGKYEIGYHFNIEPLLNEKNQINVFNNTLNKLYYVSYNILEESISYRKSNEENFKLLLSRESNGSIISDDLEKLNILKNLKLANNKSIVNYLFNTFANNSSSLQEALDVIKTLANEILSINTLDFDRIAINNELLDFINLNKNKIISLLKDVDIKIDEINIYKENKFYPIFFVRNNKEISLSQESSGTQKIFWILINVIKSLTKNNIFICDDMNAFLHPKLLRAIVELFSSKENVNSQLIFNSHDIINMDNNLFRRDEIWFIYRDENYSTQAVPLSNIVNYKGDQVRKDAKYAKQYLEGKYGADPFIKRGLSWNE